MKSPPTPRTRLLKTIYKAMIPEKTRIRWRYLVYRIRALFYFGNNVQCPVCDHRFNKFLPKGNIERNNAECPLCGSLERNRLLWLYLNKETTLLYQKIKVLHFAPENCLYKKFTKLQWDYIDADIHPDYARHTIDITEIKYPEESFDLIICSHVLGHVKNEEQALKEMFRVLKSRGILLLITLIDLKNPNTFEDPKISTDSERLEYYGESDLQRLHGMDLHKKIESFGFDVNVMDYRQQFSSEEQNTYQLGDGSRELIFICKK